MKNSHSIFVGKSIATRTPSLFFFISNPFLFFSIKTLAMLRNATRLARPTLAAFAKSTPAVKSLTEKDKKMNINSSN